MSYKSLNNIIIDDYNIDLAYYQVWNKRKKAIGNMQINVQKNGCQIFFMYPSRNSFLHQYFSGMHICCV